VYLKLDQKALPIYYSLCSAAVLAASFSSFHGRRLWLQQSQILRCKRTSLLPLP